MLLPGLDGTGELFARFVEAAPRAFDPCVIAFPRDEPLGYAELEDVVRPQLPTDGPWLLLGESFSGPLAVRLAAARPPGLAGLVLAASFVRAPAVARPLRVLARAVARVSPPQWALRVLLTGGDTELAAHVAAAVGSVADPVFAHRLREIADVDAVSALSDLAAPLLVLRATRDRVVPASAATTVTAALPTAHVVDCAAPHLVLQAAPEAAWDAIGATFPSEPVAL